MVDLHSFTNNWCRLIDKTICANCLVRPDNDCYLDVEPLHSNCSLAFQLQELFDLDFRLEELDDVFSRYTGNEDDPIFLALEREYEECDCKSSKLFSTIFDDCQKYKTPEPPNGWEHWCA